jgi:hypothetical protein
MKKNKLKILTVLVMFLLTSHACTDDFEEKNTNPNEPLKINPQYLLTTAIERSVDRMWGSSIRYERLNLDNAMSWVQYLGRNIYGNEGDDYTIQPSVYNNNWAALYNDALVNLQKIIELSGPGGAYENANYEGVALTLRSWVFSMLTDCWGAIPYSQALQGTAAKPIYSPAYDSQQFIYGELLKDLELANSKLDPAGAPINAGADILYGGNILRWKKFTNSLRLRLANRQAVKEPGSKAIMQSILNDPANNPVFESNADNARLVHATAASGLTTQLSSNNEWYVVFVPQTRTDWNVSKTLVDKLLALSDGRLAVYAKPKKNGQYEGIPNGLPDAVAANYSGTSTLGTAFQQPGTPSVVMTFAELQFILAEAVMDGDVTSPVSAQTYFQNGITASFNQHTAALGATYIADVGSITREKLFEQKWIALFGQGIESWTEYRRTGLPVFPAKDSRSVFVNDGIIPTRLPYPTTEQSLNKTEYSKAVELIGGGDNAKAKLWWVE